MNTRRYGSLTKENRSWIVKRLREEFGDDRLLRVPGFVKKVNRNGDPYIAIASGPGLLIPCRDEYGSYFALKIRLDEDTGRGKYAYLSSSKGGGPKAIMGPHFPYRRRSNQQISAPSEVLRVTEGELKADVATALDDIPTVSVPGVGNWRGVIPILQKFQAKTVHLAFDADAEINPEVAGHLIACHGGLTEAGFVVFIETWPLDQAKGIDDLLANGLKPQVLAGEAADEFLTYLQAVTELKAAKSSPAEPAAETPVTDSPNEGIDDPHRLARQFLEHEFTSKNGDRTLVFYRDEFLCYDGLCYRPIPHTDLRARLSSLIKAEFNSENLAALKEWASQTQKSDPPKCRKVTIPAVNNALAALCGLTLIPSNLQAPAWLDDSGPEGIEPADILPTKSGLLILPKAIDDHEDCLLPSTAKFFSTTGVDFAFDPNATCPAWLDFLDRLWPHDYESVETLGQWIGYLLTSDTRYHKLAMLVGPSRSGKGTIGRVIKGLIGEKNLASPKLSSLEGQFGLQPLLGKTAALIADARLSGRMDGIAIVENLLSITGEDPQDVHRKNMTTLTGIRLPVRFTILTNELPNLRDASGALTNRVILLRMTRSFIGSEDKTLGDRLAKELPGILNWAIHGLYSLRQHGGFTQPESGQELLDDLEDLASPIRQFLRECCYVGPEFTTTVEDAFRVWQDWCKLHGRDHPGTRETFGRDIRAALAHVEVRQPRVDGARVRVYQGFGIRDSF